MKTPKVCKPEAYDLFARQMPRIETTDGLLYAATAVAMHGLVDVSPDDVDLRLTAMASQVRMRVRGDSVPALIAHLHDVLFERGGLYGNTRNFYTPVNSYIPSVLETRRGVPITLCLIYKVVAQRVGLDVQGVNSPSHFLVRVRGQRDWMIVDPFFGGSLLSREEAFARLDEVTGSPVPRNRVTLEAATHRQWLARLIGNLQMVFAQQNRGEDVHALAELRELL